MNEKISYAGYVTLVGRPNVGKSTLLNRLLKRKLSITCRKAQTTRHRILGVESDQDYQTIYVDTPGITEKVNSSLTHYTNKVAYNSLVDTDLILFIVAGTKWESEDEKLLEHLRGLRVPMFLLVNKKDLVKQREIKLHDALRMPQVFEETFFISAKYDAHLDDLRGAIRKFLPPGPWLFPVNQVTDRDQKFFIAEVIREKLFRLLGEELPYEVTVVVEQVEPSAKCLKITATVYVERQGQRVIIVGSKGEKIKQIGTLARIDLEKHLGTKIFLALWVKIKTNWTKDTKLLQQLGYDELES